MMVLQCLLPTIVLTKFKVAKQTLDTVGAIFFFNEKMDNIKVKYIWEVKEIIANRQIVMKAKYFIPIYLRLTFDTTPNSTLVTHTLQVGNNPKSKIFDWFITTFIFTKSKQNSQDRHAVQEFKNREQLI